MFFFLFFCLYIYIGIVLRRDESLLQGFASHKTSRTWKIGLDGSSLNKIGRQRRVYKPYKVAYVIYYVLLIPKAIVYAFC